MSFLLDPSWMFGIACVVTPPLLACSPFIEYSDLSPRGCDLPTYFSNPAFIVSTVLCILFVYVTQSDGKKISKADRRAAHWYVVNAFIFKSIMDTWSGTLQSWPMMTAQYNALEPRYIMPFSKPESLPVHLTSILELTVMTPLCLATYWGLHRQTGWRYTIEAITATLQATGTYYFYLAGIITQGDALKKMATESNAFDFLFYFIFANVFCPLLWIVVPILRIRTVTQQVSKLQKAKRG